MATNDCQENFLLILKRILLSLKLLDGYLNSRDGLWEKAPSDINYKANIDKIDIGAQLPLSPHPYRGKLPSQAEVVLNIIWTTKCPEVHFILKMLQLHIGI